MAAVTSDYKKQSEQCSGDLLLPWSTTRARMRGVNGPRIHIFKGQFANKGVDSVDKIAHHILRVLTRVLTRVCTQILTMFAS